MVLKLIRDLNHSDLPDPIADRFKELDNEINKLKAELEGTERKELKMSIKIYNS